MPFRQGKSYDEASLYEYAIGALGRKMRSVAELKRLLRRRVTADEYGDTLVELVIRRLKDQKYLNDSAYAAAYSSYRKENEKLGRMRVISDLKVRGVHSELIEKAVGDAYAGTSEEDLARQYLRRKRLKKPEAPKEVARVFRALLRAGFTSGTIFKLLKKWDVDEEVLTALDSESGS
ncbi:MAG: RecX family transcriptional regulator [Acidobacteriaceae bacterium]|nr:RecX family transcriptional regulator [Acidobacteriaceae bacterium]